MPAPLRWPDPPLGDGVVRLDPLRPADARDLMAAAADPQARRWLPLGEPYTETHARQYVRLAAANAQQGLRLTLALRDPDAPRLLGTASLRLDGRPGEGAIGYGVAPWARGRGLAARATRLLAAYGFGRLGLHRVELLVQPGNVASRVAAERAGAQYEGLRRNGIRFSLDNRVFDALVYAFVPQDFCAGSGT